MHAACTVPGFEQETLRKFIAGGFLERHIARMRVVLSLIHIYVCRSYLY